MSIELRGACFFFPSFMSSKLNCIWCSFWMDLTFPLQVIKYFSWSDARRFLGGVNIPDKMSFALGAYPLLLIIYFIVWLVNSELSAWDNWVMFHFISSFPILFGPITFLQTVELSLGILFQSALFIRTLIEERLDLFGGLKWCFIVECNSRWY